MTAAPGRSLPDGCYRLTALHNRGCHDAFYSAPSEQPHPVAAFVIAQRGMGVDLTGLFALMDADIADGPLLGACELEFRGVLEADVEYTVRGQISPAVRKKGRSAGDFDLVDCRLEVVTPDGEIVAVITNSYVISRAADHD